VNDGAVERVWVGRHEAGLSQRISEHGKKTTPVSKGFDHLPINMALTPAGFPATTFDISRVIRILELLPSAFK
jgi:hypothetical protein